MLALQVYASLSATPRVVAVLSDQAGVDHVVVVGPTVAGDADLVTANVAANSVDTVLPLLIAAGVSGEEITVLHTDGSRPLAAAHPGTYPPGVAARWRGPTSPRRPGNTPEPSPNT